ncbi:1,4-dihydroxy-6-naphthoate synthase [Salipaludibacillus neizhouensis]|uniref:1,4-dihydroxy-6-naphtoate synthase n=1 Tax=Salipaludibacillus neizhouensis TaxID=885475 RepID=A0A3A9KNQ6_9BACI|nr:1,4-dihydroxy-6-naphthoate synthase [Salipaludibacillus neizhouensis]RKL66356.1 1,4-dihydroxy-6-naphthoate synthase [Salipaludibacillus neizhouensis]
MKMAFSSCPNDTFVFHALVHGLVDGAPSIDVTYADIDKTNNWSAENTGPELMKISYAALPWVLEEYRLIPCGGALGRGCGPLVLTKNKLTNPEELAGKTVAVPSEKSTAYLLFRLWALQQIPEGVGKIIVMPFEEIMPAVRDGKVDAGLVIHEARFTYQEFGLSMVKDLGSWWEEDTGLPIPLGAIIAKRSLDQHAIASWIQASVDYAWENPEASEAYVMEHSQEMSRDVAKSHIDLYVNSFTRELGNDGYAAIESLLGRAAKEGFVPAFEMSKLKE